MLYIHCVSLTQIALNWQVLLEYFFRKMVWNNITDYLYVRRWKLFINVFRRLVFASTTLVFGFCTPSNCFPYFSFVKAPLQFVFLIRAGFQKKTILHQTINPKKKPPGCQACYRLCGVDLAGTLDYLLPLCRKELNFRLALGKGFWPESQLPGL